MAAASRPALVTETLHLDRGYDNNVVRTLCSDLGIDDLVAAKRRIPGKGKPVKKKPVSLGMRWPVERTNSWMSNFGQLRRNTDRFIHHRLDQIALAVALVITVKLVKWADRCSLTSYPWFNRKLRVRGMGCNVDRRGSAVVHERNMQPTSVSGNDRVAT